MKAIILTLVFVLTATTGILGQNLISNSSFETSGQLNCQSWYDRCGGNLNFLCDAITPDTIFCNTDFYQDAPPGGGVWCIKSQVGMDSPIGYAQTYVTGLSLSGVFQLKFWMVSELGSWGYGEISKISQGQKTNIQTSFNSYALPWNQRTLIDTLTLTNTDTISIKFSASIGPFDAGRVKVDLVELTILDTLFTTSVENLNPITKDIKIYPNPFSTQTTLHTNYILNNATLTLYNCVGQIVKQMINISGRTFTINRDNIPNGLYFLRLTQDNKTFMVDKLVITDN